MLVGYQIVDATLYYFVFEMGMVTAKLDSNSPTEYQKRVKTLRRTRMLTMGTLLLIYSPACEISYIITVTLDKSALYYHNLVIGLLVLTRVVFTLTEGYIYYLFTKTLAFFIKKKKEVAT